MDPKPMFGRLVERLISGGQTGVDRGALDAAIALGIPHGGWCPKARRAEDGRIPTRYQLTEADVVDYEVRTRRNVQDSNGTLILSRGPLSGGSLLTAEIAAAHGKPRLHIDLKARTGDTGVAAGETRSWVIAEGIRTLNIGGPRESNAPGIQLQAQAFLARALYEPATIDEAVDQLLWELSPATRQRLTRLAEADLCRAPGEIGLYVRNAYGLLRADCPLTQDGLDDPETVSAAIVRAAWAELQRQ